MAALQQTAKQATDGILPDPRRIPARRGHHR